MSDRRVVGNNPLKKRSARPPLSRVSSSCRYPVRHKTYKIGSHWSAERPTTRQKTHDVYYRGLNKTHHIWQTPQQLLHPPLPIPNPPSPPTKKPIFIPNCGHGIIFSVSYWFRRRRPQGRFEVLQPRTPQHLKKTFMQWASRPHSRRERNKRI